MRREDTRLLSDDIRVGIDTTAMFRSFTQRIDMGIRRLQEVVQQYPGMNFQPGSTGQAGVSYAGGQNQHVKRGTRAVAAAHHLSVAID